MLFPTILRGVQNANGIEIHLLDFGNKLNNK